MHNLDKLIEDMKACEQAKGQSVYQHGEAVVVKYQSLMSNIEDIAYLDETWHLPGWFEPNKHRFLNLQMSEEDIRSYQIFHDCGKPYCLTQDASGKRHFEDHARVSCETWMRHGGSEAVGRLILHDMDVHLMKDADVDEFCAKMSQSEILILLLTSLCEIHANAELFGGMESQSFKMKWKQISKRGKAICKKLFGGVDED